MDNGKRDYGKARTDIDGRQMPTDMYERPEDISIRPLRRSYSTTGGKRNVYRRSKRKKQKNKILSLSLSLSHPRWKDPKKRKNERVKVIAPNSRKPGLKSRGNNFYVGGGVFTVVRSGGLLQQPLSFWR